MVANADPATTDDTTSAEPSPRAAIGEACAAASCAPGARCLAWTGGYCATACDADRGCGERGTACVPTPRLGAVCARACAADDDCRVDDGYLCDATWHACLLPNTAAIVPRRCPAKAAATRDPAFAASVALPAVPGVPTRAPALAIAGGVVAAVAAGAPDERSPEGNAVGAEPAIAATGSGN